MVVNTSKQSDGLSQSFGNFNKLLTEERAVFDFIEGLNEFCYLNEQTQRLYFDFLLKFTEYKGELRSEAFIKRTFSIFYNTLLKGKICKNFINEIVPKLFERMQTLIDLRYDNQACM